MFRFFLSAGVTGALLALLYWCGRLRFLRTEFTAPPRRFLALALLACVVCPCVVLPALSAGSGGSGADPTALTWFPELFSGHAILVVFLLLWWRLAPPRPFRQFLLLARPTRADWQSGLRVGAAAWLAAVAAAGIAAQILPLARQPGSGSDIPAVIPWLAHMPLSHKLLVIAVAMTVEEAFFRGFLQPRIGWIPSSILFALGHAGYGLPLMLVGVLAVSLVIGWSLERTGRLFPCIVAHGVFDAVQLLVVLPAVLRVLRL